MYNGIGLTTPRGSGTNGFVTRNLSFVRKHKDRVDYKSEEEIKKLEQTLLKQPNKDILDHERKRKVELKCMEMQELMEEQGYKPSEIEGNVSVFRKMLMEKEGVAEGTVDKDELGRPLAKETHQLAEANQEKNAKLRDAFGLTDYIEGSAFDPNRKAKEEAAKALAMAQKKYSTLSSDSDERSPSPPPKKKKKKSRDVSSSPERREKRRKSKKHKHDRSESKKHRKAKRRKKRSEEKRRRRRKRKDSSSSSADSDTDTNSDTGSSSSAESSPERRRKRKTVYGSPGSTQRQQCTDQGRALHCSSPPTESHSHTDALPLRISKQNGHSKTKTASEVKSKNGRILSPSLRQNPSGSPNYSPVESRKRSSSPQKHKTIKESLKGRSLKQGEHRRSVGTRSRSDSRSRSRTPSKQKRSPAKRSPSLSRSRSRSSSVSSSRSGSKISRRRSYSCSASPETRHRQSRSPSIRRRKGSPSHLDKRRITSARKRPVPYYRPSPPSPSSDDDSYHSYTRSRSRFRSRSRSLSLTKRYPRRRRRCSWSNSSLDSLKH